MTTSPGVPGAETPGQEPASLLDHEPSTSENSVPDCVVCHLSNPQHGGLCCAHRYDEQPPCSACPDATSLPGGAAAPWESPDGDDDWLLRDALQRLGLPQAHNEAVVALVRDWLLSYVSVGTDVTEPLAELEMK